MTVLDTFRLRLYDGEVIVIDGGMGPELTRRGIEVVPYAWVAPAILDHYDVVRQTHEDYIRAGAEVLITNTFAAGHAALRAAGLADSVVEINRLSVQAAIEARENVGREVLIAGAMLPAGFPGDHDDVVEVDRNADLGQVGAELAEQAAILVDAGADVIALEMIESTQRGILGVQAAVAAGVPVWIGVSQGLMEFEDETGVRGDFRFPFDPPGDAGEQVRLIVEAVAEADVMAVNVMHSMLDEVHPALDGVRRSWDGLLGAYPHVGEIKVASGGFVPKPIDPADFLEHAIGWVERGVQMVGGCCGIGPEHIKALSEGLPKRLPQGSRSL